MDRVRCSFEEREKALEGEKSAAEEHARWERQVDSAGLSEREGAIVLSLLKVP